MVWYIDAGFYLKDSFFLWLHTIFVTPFLTTDMLWILVPVWLNWIFAEFFQEKTGTSIGNAISNSVIIVWASVDCIRQTVNLMSAGIVTGTLNIIARFTLVGFILAYGMIILILGWKGNAIVRYIGRVREVTYIFIMFVPIFYNAIPFSWNHIISAIIFFPVFYFVLEIIDKYTPNPRAIIKDKEAETKDQFSGFDDTGANSELLGSGQGSGKFKF